MGVRGAWDGEWLGPQLASMLRVSNGDTGASSVDSTAFSGTFACGHDMT
jgi:hypothetical protein